MLRPLFPAATLVGFLQGLEHRIGDGPRLGLPELLNGADHRGVADCGIKESPQRRGLLVQDRLILQRDSVTMVASYLLNSMAYLRGALVTHNAEVGQITYAQIDRVECERAQRAVGRCLPTGVVHRQYLYQVHVESSTPLAEQR